MLPGIAERGRAQELRRTAHALQIGHEHVGRARLEMALHARAPVIRLAGGDPHVEGRRDAGAAREIVVRQRLLQPVEIVRLESPADPDGGRLVPALVRIRQQRGVATERVAQDAHTLDVFLGIGATHADLHRAMARGAERLGLLQQLVHALVDPQPARGVRRHARTIAAEEAEQRQVSGARREIPARRIERRQRHEREPGVADEVERAPGLGVPGLGRGRAADINLGQILHERGERTGAPSPEREAVPDADGTGIGAHLDGHGIDVAVVVTRRPHGTRKRDRKPVDTNVGDLELHRRSPRHCERKSFNASSDSTMTMDAADTSAVAANSSGA